MRLLLLLRIPTLLKVSKKKMTSLKPFNSHCKKTKAIRQKARQAMLLRVLQHQPRCTLPIWLLLPLPCHQHLRHLAAQISSEMRKRLAHFTTLKRQKITNLLSKREKLVCGIHFHTVRNLHFLSKNSTLISRENCRFFWVKNS